MCGICGVVNLGEKALDLIKLMNNELRHRGPDDEGYYADGSVALGMRRLSIIDLETGHQPIFNEDKSVVLICNGEIYNYLELRSELEKLGHKFYTKSDVEVLVHAYEAYGDNFLEKTLGMFAIALWDKKEKKFILAKDRIGKKPLLYAEVNKRLYFSSEFSSILKSPDINARDVNYTAIDFYLSFGYIPAPMSVYSQIKKMLPATMLIYKNGKLEEKKYWSLDYSKKIEITEDEAELQITGLLRDAVKIRMRSDVPLGAFLSGGVDSGIIVSLMAELSPRPIKTFSIGFEEKDFSELRYASQIAKMYRTDHKEILVRPDAVETLPLLARHYGEPYADSSSLPTYYLTKETKRYVTVALNGDGGDDSFGGYRRYCAMHFARYFGMLSPLLKSQSIGALLDYLPTETKKFLKGIAIREEADRYKYWMAVFYNAKKGLYTDNFLSMIEPNKAAIWYRDQFFNSSEGLDLIDNVIKTDFMSYLPYDLLPKVDIAAMANSLEVRSPFLDHRIVEFAASLKPGFKVRKCEPKYILKKVAQKRLPYKNIYRKKMGFGVPLKHWFRGELKNYLLSKLLSAKIEKRGYFKKEFIKMLIESHERGIADNSHKLWALLMLELWHESFID